MMNLRSNMSWKMKQVEKQVENGELPEYSEDEYEYNEYSLW